MTTHKHPSKNENEYFVRENAEIIKAQRARLDAVRAERLRSEHYMKCPKCGHDLKEREFHHIRVDECVQCHGMWLDKGELEMMSHVERNGFSRFIGSLFGMHHT